MQKLKHSHPTGSFEKGAGSNDVCNNLRIHAWWLARVLGAVAPARNTLSHADKTRDSEMMESLFWRTTRNLEGTRPGGVGMPYKGIRHSFKRTIHAVDSSTIALVANCLIPTKHRRRKAAVKLHLRNGCQLPPAPVYCIGFLPFSLKMAASASSRIASAEIARLSPTQKTIRMSWFSFWTKYSSFPGSIYIPKILRPWRGKATWSVSFINRYLDSESPSS